MYYTKNAKDTHPELMENALGCPSKQTNTEQKEAFNEIVRDALGPDEKKSEHFFMEIQESLNNKIEEHNSIYDDADKPIILTNDVVQEILSLSGVPEEVTTKIEKSYTENFGDTPPVADILLDNKALAAKAQKKKEEMLERQVKILESKLERVTKDSSINPEDENISSNTTEIISDSLDNENEVATELDSNSTLTENIDTDVENINSNSEENTDTNLKPNDEPENTITEDYDIVLQVKPEKVSQIKSQIIDGKKYIVIPIEENEQTAVNGVDNII